MLAAWLSLVLAIDPRARHADVSGGIAAEMRLGTAPTAAGQPTRAAFVFIATPEVGLRVRDRRRNAFTLGYAPRLLIRQPNYLGVNRPLVLHQLRALYLSQMTRKWSFGLGATANVGEVDYTANILVFAPS